MHFGDQPTPTPQNELDERNNISVVVSTGWLSQSRFGILSFSHTHIFSYFAFGHDGNTAGSLGSVYGWVDLFSRVGLLCALCDHATLFSHLIAIYPLVVIMPRVGLPSVLDKCEMVRTSDAIHWCVKTVSVTRLRARSELNAGKSEIFNSYHSSE
jgi:hypothetical protein